MANILIIDDEASIRETRTSWDEGISRASVVDPEALPGTAGVSPALERQAGGYEIKTIVSSERQREIRGRDARAPR